MTDHLVNFLHLLATTIWLGGAAYMHLVLYPSLRAINPQQSAKLNGIIAKRFSIIAWSCVIVLIVTGLMKTPDGMLFDTSSDMGFTLMLKHILVIAMVAVGLTIGLYTVPHLRRAAPKEGEQPSEEFFKYQKLLGRLASANLVLGLIVIFFASALW
jgi:uncharacterized membrane protein